MKLTTGQERLERLIEAGKITPEDIKQRFFEYLYDIYDCSYDDICDFIEFDFQNLETFKQNRIIFENDYIRDD